MAVKVYTPGQFYAAGGVVGEMFYQEVGRTKKYLRKRVGFVRSFEQVIKNLNDEAWRKFHYMKANVRGVDYTLVYDPEDMGLGIEEKVISLTREGDRLKTEYTSERAYINDGFEFLIECSDCKAITKVEKYGLSENKPYITRCSQCGKIFINPYYKDPVSESWEKNPPTQIVD